MSDPFITKREKRSSFSFIPNVIWRDGRLSWGAKGLMGYILHLPDNFKLRLSHLAKQCSDKRDSTRARIKELESCGYIKITRERGQCGRFTGVFWEVSEEPDFYTKAENQPRSEKPNMVDLGCLGKTALHPYPENPTVVKPLQENPAKANPTLISTNTEQILSVINTTTKAHRDLLFPPQLTIEEQQSITNGLKGLSAQDAQLLLDELAHAIQASKIKSSRVGWLFSVKKKFLAGQFNPVGAIKIASQRKQASEQGLVPPVEARPVDRQRGQKEARRLKELLATSRHKKQA
ncbi:hypothetical protein ABE441_17550 [Alcaligenes aquatilis]|uniref:hypothetical protein n=1 Tax=Alcaligenes aquatilis TaxID=323284 RepID=UPI00320A3ABB